MNPGDKILVNNGLVIFEVLGVEGEDIHCRVEVGGELSNRKSMSFPNKVLKQTYLSEQDKADLLFGIENGVDFIAASFVSCKQDVLDLKDFLAANGGEKIDVIKYSENPEELIAAALSPAEVLSVTVDPEGQKSCRVIVPDHQLSLAIGNKGQNVRLAARLTGWKIDIGSESSAHESAKAAEDEE